MGFLKATSILFLVFAVCGFAEEKPIQKNAITYIEEMEQDLDGYLRAAFFKKKVPLQIVMSEEKADIVLRGEITRADPFTGAGVHEHKITANLLVIERKTQELLFATQAGDASAVGWPGDWGGLPRVAERLANNLKKAIRNK